MKFKRYIASVACTYQVNTDIDEFVVLERDALGYSTENVFSTKDEAKEFCLNSDHEAVWIMRKQKALRTEIIQYGDTFDSHADALSWAGNRETEYGERFAVVHFRSSISDVMVDSDEHEEYQPVYEMEVEVRVIKRITVTVDTEDYREVEDEYDAQEKARQLIDDGELDDDIRYADVDEYEIDVLSIEET
jgi:hypothetical protein